MEFEYLLSKHFFNQGRSETSIESLAKRLNCSTRYTKTIVHKLHAQQKILWETSRGRGKKPFITVFRSEEEVLIEWLESLWEDGNFEEVIRLCERDEFVKLPMIHSWLNIKFGVQTFENEHVFIQPMYPVELFLDPLTSISRHDSHILEQIHETLFIINEVGEVKPNLVFAYHTMDHVNWSFVLRKGVYFHDGSTFTAEDAVASIQYVFARYKHLVQIQSIKVINTYEFSIQLSSPFSMLHHLLATPRLIMMKANINPLIGCGPFELIKNSAEKIVFKTFERYFKERPWIDRIELLITDDFSSSMVHYKPFDDGPYYKMTQQEQGANYCTFNSATGVLKDVEKRAYVWHLINPSDFIFNTEREAITYGWTTTADKVEVNQYDAVPCFDTVLTVGYQQIRNGVNYLPQAKKISGLLAAANIQTQLICLDFQADGDKRSSEVDIFIGGSAILRNRALSLFIYYSTYGQSSINAMSVEDRQRAEMLLEQAKRSSNPMEQFDELEVFLQKTFHLKFLVSRKHYYYVRQNTNFGKIEFDDNGRINYRKLYVAEKGNFYDIANHKH